MSTQQISVSSASVARVAFPARSSPFLKDYFYFSMSLLIAAIVVYGFSHTVSANLIHPKPPRPLILYIHAAIFTAWLVFLISQTALVRTRNVRLHRKLGWFGVGLGVLIPVVGAATAITMSRFSLANHRFPDVEQFLIVPLWDLTAFTTFFALAVYWRKKPEFHRRLIFVASCALTSAGFGRFPTQLAAHWFYVGVDLVVLLGVVRDLIVTRRIHPVYRYALAFLVLGQSIAMYAYVHNSPVWLRIAHALLS